MNQNELVPLAKKAFCAESFLRNSSSSSTLPINTRTEDYKFNASVGDITRHILVNEVLLTYGSNPKHFKQWPTQKNILAYTASPTNIVSPFATTYSAAFEELARVRADTSNFLKAICLLRNAELITEREALADRLTVLLQDYQDDYGQSLDAESLHTFIAFVSFYPELKRPIITATPDGNLFAEWKGDEGSRYLGVQFLPTRQVRYVAIRPNPQHPQHRIRSSGVITTDQLLAEIPSHNIGDWANRAK
jgi:hypothetical protein